MMNQNTKKLIFSAIAVVGAACLLAMGVITDEQFAAVLKGMAGM